MNARDKKLIKAYEAGWNDCSGKISLESKYETALERKSYRIGWAHYIIGDDVTSIDSWSDERILEEIRGKRKTRTKRIIAVIKHKRQKYAKRKSKKKHC